MNARELLSWRWLNLDFSVANIVAPRAVAILLRNGPSCYRMNDRSDGSRSIYCDMPIAVPIVTTVSCTVTVPIVIPVASVMLSRFARRQARAMPALFAAPVPPCWPAIVVTMFAVSLAMEIPVVFVPAFFVVVVSRECAYAEREGNNRNCDSLGKRHCGLPLR